MKQGMLPTSSRVAAGISDKAGIPGACRMPSSVIASMKYDPVHTTLQIKFVSGLIYEYQQVPLEVFQAMKKAVSKGTFLNQYIKGNYSFRKIGQH